MRPSKEDINAALAVEWSLTEDQLPLYLECMNNLPMSKRTSDRELRDGCILTWHVFNALREEGT